MFSAFVMFIMPVFLKSISYMRTQLSNIYYASVIFLKEFLLNFIVFN